jgi:hypothetical protein
MSVYTEPMIVIQDKDNNFIIEKPYPKKNIIHTVNDFAVVHQVVFPNDIRIGFTPFFMVLHIPSAKVVSVLFKKKHFAIRFMLLFEEYFTNSPFTDEKERNRDAYNQAILQYEQE